MAAAAIGTARSAVAQDPCVVANTGGTVVLPPPGCEYLSPEEVHEIIDGLPPSPPTTIELAPIHNEFILRSEGPGGNLGGRIEIFDSILQLQVDGTGLLAGFSRFLTIPVACETHTGPRNPGDAIQDFDTEMVQLQGELFGDPDFCLLRVTGGTNFGMPSPGHTTLTRLGPPGSSFNVDSFFDVEYRIEFQGCPGSALEGFGGITQATIRMQAGEPAECGPTADGTGCEPVSCPIAGEECQSTCVEFDPATGQTVVTQCDCKPLDECSVQTAQAPTPARDTGSDPCVVADPGSGTIELPPMGCEYLSPEEVHEIIDSSGSGVTFELAPIHKNFICNRGDGFPGCPPPGFCEGPGGTYGGNVDCFESSLELDVSSPSLPGFNRTLSVPVLVQVETGPRTPGDAVQSFPTRMNFVQGELFGDPDFCLFRVTGGDGFGMPSPGHTTLTRLGPPGSSFVVDSFFDVEYRIEFQGCPDSPVEGMFGDTTATIHMETGGVPECVGGCPPGETCERSEVVTPTGTIEICCRCLPPPDPHKTVEPTTVDFGFSDVPPIPADFFDPGSEPFTGPIPFLGSAPPGEPDTLIQRSSSLGPIPLGDSRTVDIEMVALSLRSVDPITVVNGTSTSLWDVDVHLSNIGSSGIDGLTATKTNPNGGTYDARIPVVPRFTFTKVGDPTEQRVLDYGALGLSPIEINIFAAPWVVTVDDPDLQ
ncbi:MAG: hypothetical protein PVI86_05950, partial [Phycisphaerae bacterium]